MTFSGEDNGFLLAGLEHTTSVNMVVEACRLLKTGLKCFRKFGERSGEWSHFRLISAPASSNIRVISPSAAQIRQGSGKRPSGLSTESRVDASPNPVCGQPRGLTVGRAVTGGCQSAKPAKPLPRH